MRKGFTLVEILVAVTIFVTVVSVASMLFVQAIRGQRLNLAYQELLDQTSYVMEYMSRSIRMARRDDGACTGSSDYNYVTSTIGTKECLHFKDYTGECRYFCLDGTKLVTATNTLAFTDLTSSDLSVSSFNITGQGWEGPGPPLNDTLQPLVTIFLEVEGREQSNIQIKTSISQRNLDM